MHRRKWRCEMKISTRYLLQAVESSPRKVYLETLAEVEDTDYIASSTSVITASAMTFCRSS